MTNVALIGDVRGARRVSPAVASQRAWQTPQLMGKEVSHGTTSE
jgi:hypothetical protein